MSSRTLRSSTSSCRAFVRGDSSEAAELDWSRRNDTEGHELDNLELHVRPFHVEKVDVHEKFDDALSCGRVVVRWCTIRDGEVFAVARAPMIHNSISAQH
jgi:hypothetical protein